MPRELGKGNVVRGEGTQMVAGTWGKPLIADIQEKKMALTLAWFIDRNERTDLKYVCKSLKDRNTVVVTILRTRKE